MRSALFQLAMLFVFFFIFIRFVNSRSRKAREAQAASSQAAGQEHFLSGYSDEFVTLYKDFATFSHQKPGAALRFIDKTIAMAPPLNKQPLASCITTFFDQCCDKVAVPYLPILFSKISAISPSLPFAMRNGETRAITNNFLQRIQSAIDSAFDHVAENGTFHVAQQTAHNVLSLVQLNHILINSARTQFPTRLLRMLHEAMVCAFPSEWKDKDRASLETLIEEASAFFAAKKRQGLPSLTESLDELLPLWKSQSKVTSQPSNLGSSRAYDEFEKYLFTLRQQPMTHLPEAVSIKKEKPALSSTTENKKTSASSQSARSNPHPTASVNKEKAPKIPLPSPEPLAPEILLSDTALTLPPLAEEQPHPSPHAWKKPAPTTISPLPPQSIAIPSPPFSTQSGASNQKTEPEKTDKPRPSSYKPPTIKSSYKRT